MDILENSLDPKDLANDFLLNGAKVKDLWYLGIISGYFLSNPTIKSVEPLLKLVPELSIESQEVITAVSLEILVKILNFSHKQEEIAIIYEQIAGKLLELNSSIVNKKLVILLDNLLERVSCDTGLKLYKLVVNNLNLTHPIKKLNSAYLHNLDVSFPDNPGNRFKAVNEAYELCSEQKYSVLNSIAFRCIEHTLRYEIKDFSPYREAIEEKLKHFNNKFTFEQRLKLSKLYEHICELSKNDVDRNIVRSLTSLKFSDRTCVDYNKLNFNFLVEDILQFQLSDQVIRDRIKSLHGKYKGKVFVAELLSALKAVSDDEPGYEVMSKISKILKELKFLSKNEYQRYKRNELKFSYIDDLPLEENKVDNKPKDVPNYFKQIDSTLIDKGIKMIDKVAKELNPSASFQLFGSYCTNFWVENTDIDVNIIASNLEDKLSFALALKVNLNQIGEANLIDSKSLPIVKFKPPTLDFNFNLTINNEKGSESTEILKKFSVLSPKIGQLVKEIKVWASSNNIKNPAKGTLSGYEWTLIAISFLQSLSLAPKLNSYSNAPIDIKQESTELFSKFLNYLYDIIGFSVNIITGDTQKSSKNLFLSAINPIDGLEFSSRIKKDRKQGKVFRKILEQSIKNLA
jgi:predicted nucleotidyltransferase